MESLLKDYSNSLAYKQQTLFYIVHLFYQELLYPLIIDGFCS